MSSAVRPERRLGEPAAADLPLVEDELAADDPRLPGRVREHAAGFRRKRVVWVALVGREYVLLARDGEVVDIVGDGSPVLAPAVREPAAGWRRLAEAAPGQARPAHAG